MTQLVLFINLQTFFTYHHLKKTRKKIYKTTRSAYPI